MDHDPAHPELPTGPESVRQTVENLHSGREFAVRHSNIWRIADDKIADHWGTRDDLGLLGQLGLLQTGQEAGR